MITPSGDRSVVVAVRVVPGAGRSQITGVRGDELHVRVSAPPVDGRANEEVCRVLAAALGVRRRQVELRSGHRSRSKTLLVEGVDESTARTLLLSGISQNKAADR